MNTEDEAKKRDNPFKTNVGTALNAGLVRDDNEDALLAIDLALYDGDDAVVASLYAVADGMGGHQAGEVASNRAIEILAEQTQKALKDLAANGMLDKDSVSGMLIEAVQEANSDIYDENSRTGNNMGTTLVATLLFGKLAYIINVGDSRAYLLDEGGLQKVTTDHSLVASLVTAGQISVEDIYTHPQRNIITRCLGTHKNVKVDLFIKKLRPGVSLVLCSDGLWEMVRDDTLKDVLLNSDSPQEACEALVKSANENGGIDNISVIILRVE